jgi:hypothetical protein
MEIVCSVALDGEDCGSVPIVEYQGRKVFGDACYWLIDLLEPHDCAEHVRYRRAEAGILDGVARGATAGAFPLGSRMITWRLGKPDDRTSRAGARL